MTMARQLDVQYVNYYCAGSSALKVAPAISVKPLEIPRKKKVKKLVLRIDPIACTGILLAAVMMILLSVGFVQLSNVRAEAATMESYVDILQQENDALQAEFEAGYNLEEVESVALALGMVPEDQVRHISVPADDAAQESQTEGWHNMWVCVFDLLS